MSGPEGLLLVDKPKGITSHDVVNRIRRALEIRKVGHAGTLDPMATGLMLIGVGRATRLLRYLTGLDKIYEGTGRLGEETDTLDADGRITRTSEVAASREDVEKAMASLTGEIEQIPPAYSAVKVEGRKLYEAARRGEHVQGAPRRVVISSFELTSFDGRDFVFEVHCSSGTYVRTLAADVGAALGCGAHLTRLVRTRVGGFGIDQATSLENVGRPLPLEAAVKHLSRRDLDGAQAEAVVDGRPLDPTGIEGPYACFDPEGMLLAVYRDRGSIAKAEMVLPPQSPRTDGAASMHPGFE